MARFRKRTWLIAFLVFAVGMFALSSLVLSSWSALRTVGPVEAQEAFSVLRTGVAAGPAYLVVSPDDEVVVNRELEGPEPIDLDSLNLLVWEPDSGRLLRIDFPFWFVRMKLSDTMNLGTLASLAVRDWDHLDLRVTEDDLALRGPGLVLDHTRPDGGRLLLWLQ